MDFFKQQAASFLDSQNDDESRKKKPAASEFEEEPQQQGRHASSAGGYGGAPTKKPSEFEEEPQEGRHASSAGGAPTKNPAQDDDVPSYQELMSSANVLMGAAKGKFGGGGGGGEGKELQGKKAEADPAKLAGAAHDFIDAAQHYGKFDESSQIGGYLKKAEGYVQSYDKNPRETEAAVRDLSAARDSEEERRR